MFNCACSICWFKLIFLETSLFLQSQDASKICCEEFSWSQDYSTQEISGHHYSRCGDLAPASISLILSLKVGDIVFLEQMNNHEVQAYCITFCIHKVHSNKQSSLRLTSPASCAISLWLDRQRLTLALFSKKIMA